MHRFWFDSNKLCTCTFQTRHSITNTLPYTCTCRYFYCLSYSDTNCEKPDHSAPKLHSLIWVYTICSDTCHHIKLSKHQNYNSTMCCMLCKQCQKLSAFTTVSSKAVVKPSIKNSFLEHLLCLYQDQDSWI